MLWTDWNDEPQLLKRGDGIIRHRCKAALVWRIFVYPLV